PRDVTGVEGRHPFRTRPTLSAPVHALAISLLHSNRGCGSLCMANPYGYRTTFERAAETHPARRLWHPQPGGRAAHHAWVVTLEAGRPERRACDRLDRHGQTRTDG